MMYILYIQYVQLKKHLKLKHVLRTVWYSILGMQKSSHVTGAADSKSQVPAVIGLNEEVHCTFCDFFVAVLTSKKAELSNKKCVLINKKCVLINKKCVLINKKMF